MNNGGDVLARGARKANFPAAGGKVSQEKWNDIFADYESELDKKEAREKKNTQE